jgi:hypothetical protein
MISIVLFAVAALGGAFLASLRFRGKDLPMPLALVHGVVAAAGLVTLLLAVLQGHAVGLATIALGILVVAALGGFVLFSFHLRRKPIPIPLMLVHAVVAVAGFGTLCASVFGGRVAP